MKNFKGLIITLIIAGIASIWISSCKNNNILPVNIPGTSKNHTPTITTIVPAMALPNSEISIIGTNFNTRLANNSVTINGVAAVVDSASATEIVVTVPANATTGKVTLVTGGAILTSPSDFTVASTIIDLGPDNSHYVYLEHIASAISSNDYYGDNGSDTVYKTQLRTTTILAVINNPGGNTLWGTALDTTGNVYETGQTTSVIYKITPAGEVSILAGNGTAGHADGQGTAAQFSHPMGLAIDAKGNLYTNDHHYIRKISPAGIVSTIAGNGIDGYKDGPAKTAEFGNIEGITVDAKGNVYVSDNKYFNIRKISAGAVTTLAGSGTSGNVDGQGAAAQFLFPQAMAADAAGNIFVSDNDPINFSVQNVRRITQTGLVSTFLPGHFHFPDGITFTRNGAMLICNTLNTYNGGYVSCVLFGN
ncbi:MAG: repeat containing protein [Mucilaginibacter sp.]|nr:repeat containing protein [Mucilaginibacter sp.]